jgi:flagellin
MGFRINTNVAAMNSHMNSVNNNRELDKSLTALSTGLRINKAADDASGLAIANQLKSQANGLGQAIRNANDGINLAQTADGALEEYTNIINTVRTKAIQAASDGQTDKSRQAIQADINKLLEEAQNIAKSTSFNGQKLLSGSFTDKKFQVGAYSNETVSLNIADTRINKIGLTTRSELNLASDGGEVKLSLTSASSGQKIDLKAIDIKYNNSPENGIGALADEINKYTDQTGIKANAIVDITTSTAIKAGTTGEDFSINGVKIGAVTVEDNDNSNSLVSAINAKSNQTGVTASLEAGKLTLTSNDGRAIKVDGDVSDVMGTTASSMSTVGHIELVQKGSADFLINATGAGATGADISTKSQVTTSQDSILAAGSTIEANSQFAKGSVIGGDVSNAAQISSTSLDSTIKAGSTIEANSQMKQGTVIGGSMSAKADTAIKEDMLLTAGSTLESGSVLGKGTIITTEFTQGGKTYKKGEILDTAVTLQEDLSLKADMTLKYNGVSTDNSQIKANSLLNTGSRLGADISNASQMKVTENMTLKAGSTIEANSKFAAGSSLGGAFSAAAQVNTSVTTELKAGSTLEANTKLAEGSNLGAKISAAQDVTLKDSMNLKAGTILESGSKIAKGTELTQDITAGGTTYKAGTVLSSDLTTDSQITLTKDMRLKENSVIKANSSIAINTDNEGGIEVDKGEVSSLANIDVTTLDGALKAIDTLDAALQNIDSIRSNIGSVQNQLESTVRNISVTQVNVTAAESSIRDVDFAAESANLKKRNILAQSGVYAMSQANAAQQNVMRLLQ